MFSPFGVFERRDQKEAQDLVKEMEQPLQEISDKLQSGLEEEMAVEEPEDSEVPAETADVMDKLGELMEVTVNDKNTESSEQVNQNKRPHSVSDAESLALPIAKKSKTVEMDEIAWKDIQDRLSRHEDILLKLQSLQNPSDSAASASTLVVGSFPTSEEAIRCDMDGCFNPRALYRQLEPVQMEEEEKENVDVTILVQAMNRQTRCYVVLQLMSLLLLFLNVVGVFCQAKE